MVNAESFDKLDKELDEIREVSCRKLFLLLSKGWSVITCEERLEVGRGGGGEAAILLGNNFQNLDWFWG